MMVRVLQRETDSLLSTSLIVKSTIKLANGENLLLVSCPWRILKHYFLSVIVDVDFFITTFIYDKLSHYLYLLSFH